MSATAERELRLAVVPLAGIDVRDATGTGDGSWTIEGYAAVFEQETVLYDSQWWRLREKIARDAFDSVLARDPLVHLNFGHDMNTAIAATNVTGVGSLELSADSHGLRFFARVDPEDPDAVRLAAKLRRGVVRQASFAFTIARSELLEIETENGKLDELRTILEVGELYDVCACPQGAYPQTESHLRSLLAASIGRAGTDPAGLPHRALVAGETTIAYEAGGRDESAGAAVSRRRLAAAKARARAARLTHPRKEAPR